MLPVAIVLLAFALRFASLDKYRFLEDEALYAYWGLQIATGADPWLNDEPVDKPPLYPYLLALDYSLLALPSDAQARGSVLEAAARLPSLLASTAGVSLTYALARRLYPNTLVAVLAALLVAASPFDALFASTVFTDPLMSALGLASVTAAVSRNPALSGLLAGFATATKQQGLLFLPLSLLMGQLATPHPASRSRPARPEHRERHLPRARQLPAAVLRWPGLRVLVVFASVVAATVSWDLARVQRPGFLSQSFISYGGLSLAQRSELADRGLEWLHWLAQLWASPGLAVLLVAALALGAFRWRRQRVGSSNCTADLILVAYTLCLLLFLWLVDFQVWDRYLLPIVPLLALIIARGLLLPAGALTAGLRRTLYQAIVTLLLLASLVAPLAAALHGDLAVGGDHGAYDGIDELAIYVQDSVPANATIYHLWLGYHYRFYLYGLPLRLHWYPDLEDLVRDARIYRREPRYIAFPSWKDSTPITAALDRAGILLVPQLETRRRDGTVSIRLFRLLGPRVVGSAPPRGAAPPQA